MAYLRLKHLAVFGFRMSKSATFEKLLLAVWQYAVWQPTR